jgi:GT2 family glycosyltransferase
MQLSILIVSYNTAKLTLETLDSVVADITASTFRSKPLANQTEIIIVDNASTDTSVPEIEKWISAQKKSLTTTDTKLKFTLLKNTKNIGFAQANNQAIAESSGTYVFLLNSDTIVKPGATISLLETFKENPTDHTTAYVGSNAGKLDRLGILAASLLNPDGTYQAQGGDLPNLLTLSAHLLFLDDIPVLGQFLPSTQHTGKRALKPRFDIVQKGWVAATAIMVKRSLITDIGDLDGNIFMYGEDMEWCVRAQAHHWDIAINYTAQIVHYGSASSHSSRAILGELQGYTYIWAKHKPQWQRPLLKLLLKVACGLRVLVFGTILKQQQRAEPYKVFLEHHLAQNT